MSDRFADLKKFPEGPAARILADGNMKLDTKLDSPVSAPVSVVLEELEAKSAQPDMLKVVAVSLPTREAVWWACLAARDLAGEEGTPLLKAAETWVFEPTDENREKLAQIVEVAGPDDPAALCGTAALYGDGTLGPGEMKDYPAPQGAAAISALGQNFESLDVGDDVNARMDLLIDRALDIARGGNGRIEPKSEDESADEASGDGSEG